ncbi:MerR family DNA-binding protein [Sphingomonas alpina]|uniref:MerR family DNA-binding protein n=1 Tax=Sphingomonas alpina TaxID=653931 RepID=A0A7H0LFE7_9SPHN|nr:MerR family DNA-binding protein [Sphingomonas alpina]QNQ08400.1 MerR family DNA-binding protein [Sphingomonas alpina]
MKPMTISGLARSGGVGVETIRYYQRLGLIDLPERSGGNGLSGGMRRYDAGHADRLRFIRAGQRAGFTLDQIGQLLALDARHDHDAARALAEERIAALDARIAEMQEARTALARLARQCGTAAAETNPAPCPIITAFDRH